jgi:transcriptional regulator with XRE-family HTH domain
MTGFTLRMARSLRVVPEYINKVKLARPHNGFPRQQDLAEALGLSRDTVSNFLNGKPVDYLNFLELCRILALDWREVTGLGSQDTTGSQSEQFIATFDNDTLYKTLLRLNFTNQVSLFRHFVETHRVGSCLIHGEPEYGQR